MLYRKTPVLALREGSLAEARRRVERSLAELGETNRSKRLTAEHAEIAEINLMIHGCPYLCVLCDLGG
jgi:hypothetical protein